MGSTELARLCENLSIKEEDNEIHQIADDIGRVGEEEVEHCLVGKVLSGKRVNREAFRTVMEQLWSPFGNVEIEAVGENIFMFYFKNPEDRDRIWQRGPWHFDRSLTVLEKPEGTGEIAQLSFNKAEFWVQIHDIPIMCMNRRIAKWLAEQIASQTLLRLKLDKSGNIVVVGLKYERLPDFCYTCGRVGHGINECFDGEAKKEALEGTSTKYGSWLRATLVEKVKMKSPSQGSGGSSVKERTSEDYRETVNKGSSTREMSLPDDRKGEPESSTMVASRDAVVNNPEGSPFEERAGNEFLDRMCVDGSSSGPGCVIGEEAQGSGGLVSGERSKSPVLPSMGPRALMIEEQVESPRKQFGNQDPVRDVVSEVQTGLKTRGKKWKRVAREAQRKQKSGLLASPLQRKLMVNIPSLKSPIKISPFKNSNSPNRTNSPIRISFSPKTSSEKRKAGLSSNFQPSSQSQSNPTKQNLDRRLEGSSKRKVIFEFPVDGRETKRGKSMESFESDPIRIESAEPVEQARREP
ncbi:hypothetical protein EZV62_024052 [Acer yangbiense]|uniref:CCHC-type domain-containing protein n=1 Tax=Acer yangbiense TaxID=1000413 RepID=A0A5C7H3I8_9ROSI|nr:hypothetical protein EZV62_024052 [Acer yangbiense]